MLLSLAIHNLAIIRRAIDAVPDETTRNAILVGSPAELSGFEG